ncbi:MAG: hypothetical protein JNK37_07000 [Verrucomicrobiales bacterium]|nr:hypothetical protein [Verrucomicrobiales bacterium]
MPRFLPAALATLLWIAASTASQAQVAIYRFDFEKEGPSINYGFYEEAWVVADAAGGPASWVLMFREGAHRRYIVVEDFGSLFFPNKGRTVVGVISAAAASGTPQTTFLAIGEVEQSVKAGNVTVKVPTEMKGYALSADDESEVPFTSNEGDVGYAGISTMKGSLQVTRTADANSRNQSVEDALAEVEAYVKRRGYTEFVVAATNDQQQQQGQQQQQQQQANP